jgi:hypothetical protein
MQRSLNPQKVFRTTRLRMLREINLGFATRCRSIVPKSQAIQLEVKEADNTS